MNRTDRLLAVVLELGQGKDWVRAEDLALQFSVSLRTIYRDVLALNEAGVPILSVPGQGYRLMEGYFLPPLHLSAEEALMLAFGLDAVQGAFDAEYARAAVSAAKKLLAALPAERREQVAALRTQMRLVEPEDDRHATALRVLRTALLSRKAVSFRYHAPGGASVRSADPHGLVRLNGVWLLAAHDHVRAALRNFRLDRMEEIRLDESPVTTQGQAERRPADERRDLRVRLRFPADLERWVCERPNFFQTAAASSPAGYEVTLMVRVLADILPWVLSWGAQVQVLGPPELLSRVQTEARAMLDVAALQHEQALLT
jgi:predicted DNA-binding transcriptional regulator YafY